MQARMTHPVQVFPDALKALLALTKVIQESGVPPNLAELISLRASQINGCGVCALQHPRIARKLGETDDRLFAVAAWRDAPYFTDAERAALALTEAATRLSDRPDPCRTRSGTRSSSTTMSEPVPAWCLPSPPSTCGTGSMSSPDRSREWRGDGWRQRTTGSSSERHRR